KRKPCLLAVDEMPAQGYNRAIETAAPVMRSYGLQLLAIAQDIAGVKAAYPTTWETFISNADAVFWMAANSQETISYLEKVSAQRRTWRRSMKRKRTIERERPLMYAEQIRRFLDPARGRVIV